MNMKKTLAGLMAGVVAISAMATVAVSAKAQKADEVTWSTMAAPTKSAESIVYVTLTPDGAPAFAEDDTLTLSWATSNGTLEIDSITKITYRLDGSTSVDTEDLDRLYDVNEAKDTITFLTDASDATATVEIAIKVKSSEDIIKNDAEVDFSGAAEAKSSNVKKDADSTKQGVLLNIPEDEDAESARDLTVVIEDLDDVIDRHMNKTYHVEPTEEIADFLKDAKGATIAFNFEKKDTDESVSDKEFAEWVDRYDWTADSMKSAISLRINNSNVLSVDMMEFDKANFSAVYSWDEVMAKFQVGSAAGLVHTMGLKINNSKLPAQKDASNKVIELKLASITVKIPELAETNDDTMVEDFAAGESATVVEDTLPVATDAPAADAPAADAPATTDAAANPETGNSAVALLAIPAALAAAAIVAKKRG